MKKFALILLPFIIATAPAFAQNSQRTRIQGNTEINATTNNMTAIASGENNVAKNRIGVIQGEKRGDTKVNVVTGNVTTIAGGRNKKACTNIGGIVSNECK